jgi:hypothetical protein
VGSARAGIDLKMHDPKKAESIHGTSRDAL